MKKIIFPKQSILVYMHKGIFVIFVIGLQGDLTLTVLTNGVDGSVKKDKN
jgi:hypothetical protein